MHMKAGWAGVFLAAVMVLVLTAPAVAQDEQPEIGVWKRDFEIGVNVLQSSYSQNWNGGEKGSIVWAGIFNGNMEKHLSEKTFWRNTLKLAYGQTHNQERNADGSLYWKRPDKTNDLIDFESIMIRTLDGYIDPFVAFNFTSMFEDLTDTDQRALKFNPMTFKETVGLSREFIGEENRSLLMRLGAAFIQNSREYFPNAFPDLTTEKVSSTELAAELVTHYKAKTMNDKVDWESKLTLSLPFVYSGKSVFEDDLSQAQLSVLPDDIANFTTVMDVDWENTFATQLTSLLGVKFFVRWVYDKYDNTVGPVVDDSGNLVNEATVQQAIRKAGQFQQTLALAFSYKFN